MRNILVYAIAVVPFVFIVMAIAMSAAAKLFG